MSQARYACSEAATNFSARSVHLSGDMNTSTKIGLSVVEAGWLLQRSEGQIRGMLRRGQLTYVVEARRIDPESVRSRLGGAYARLLLDLVLGSEFEVPRPERRWRPPAPLYPGVLGLALQMGFAVAKDEVEPLMDELVRTHPRSGAAEVARPLSR